MGFSVQGKFVFELVDSEDGMDQSKWALPRHRVVQRSKASANLARPRMKLHGVWVHNVCLHLFVIHPCVSADSSLVCEAFQRVLQLTSEEFEKMGKQMPESCAIWATSLHGSIETFSLMSFACYIARDL